MGDHAKLSPSSAHRWVYCPGSVKFCAGYPDESSEAADRGTYAHLLAAAFLKKDRWLYATKEMVSYVRTYTDDILRRAEGKLLMVEQKVPVSQWTSEPGGFGTSDAILYDFATCTLEVRDLKYGMEIVEADDNEQTMLYALGAKHLLESLGLEVKKVIMAIHQPRRDHMSECEITLDALNLFGAYSASQGHVALNCFPGEALHPHPKACVYCPAKVDCPPYNAKVQKILFEEYKQEQGKMLVSRPIEEETTPGELDMAEAWIKAKRKWIFDQLCAGAEFKSWKLVMGRGGNRKFTDVTAVENELRRMKLKVSEIKETTLLPITKLEKIVGKARWSRLTPYITQAPGQPQLAPMSDKREKYQTALDSEFTIVPQEEFKI